MQSSIYGVRTRAKLNSGEELKAFLSEILPDYDRERVYTSDIKKMVMWYNLLAEKDMLDFSDEEDDEATEENKSQTEKGEETKPESAAGNTDNG